MSLAASVAAALLRVIRNVSLKAAYDTADAEADVGVGSDSAAAKAALLLKMNAYASLWLLLSTCALFASQLTAIGLDSAAVAQVAGLHAAGSLLSLFAILQHLTVVGHAVCRVVKNTAAFVAFTLTGDNRELGGSAHAVAAALLIVGVAVYVNSSSIGEARRGTASSIERLQTPFFTLVTVCLVLFVGLGARTAPSAAADRPAAAFFPPEPRSHSALRNSSIQLAEAALPPTPAAAGMTAVSPRSTRPPYLFGDPLAASLASNDLRTVDAVADEARRLHDSIFSRLLRGYRRAVLVNLFTWANKGDHLITIGELKILERFNLTIIHSCFYLAASCQFERVPREANIVVLVQGGGYTGHPSHERMFANVVRSFPAQRVILLPSSTCYPTPPCSGLDALVRTLRNHSDFHALLRDAYSYETIRQAVTAAGASGVHFYLVPDIAWAVSSLRVDVAPTYDIVWLKRTDWEAATADAAPPSPAGVRVQVMDWSDTWMGQDEANYWERSQLRVLSGVAFLARGRVVISDRLHAHIMCQLMRKPNVLVNSLTRKQEHYYATWERSIESSRLARNNSEALTMALELLRSHGGPVAVPSVNPV